MSIANDAGNGKDSDTQKESQGNFQAAVARTATRSLALYFSRPVRIFKPTKVASQGYLSGWQILRNLAVRDGASVSPKYIQGLVSSHGFMVLPKHFFPPIMVNAVLGTVLWTTYSETSAFLEPHIGNHLTTTAALSGAVAGAAQAVAAAPAENVRILMEGSSSYNSWSHAWKEVFRGAEVIEPSVSIKQSRDQARQVYSWMKDVKQMAGRGWDGWSWGCAKDMCGFAAFFAIFEVTRRVSFHTTEAASSIRLNQVDGNVGTQFPKIVHGMTLVSGGVIAGLAYEFVGRPFDAARRLVTMKTPDQSISQIISGTLQNRGLLYFFRDPSAVIDHIEPDSALRRRAILGLRTLGRVGPWGIGFLVWEAYGSGLNPSF